MTRARARIETRKRTWRNQINAARAARLAGESHRFHRFMKLTHQRVLWDLLIAYIDEA